MYISINPIDWDKEKNSTKNVSIGGNGRIKEEGFLFRDGQTSNKCSIAWVKNTI